MSTNQVVRCRFVHVIVALFLCWGTAQGGELGQVPHGDFEEWTTDQASIPGWDLAGNLFPKGWRTEGRPGETGTLRRVVNPADEIDAFGRTAIYLDGKIFTESAAADVPLDGRNIILSFWAKGEHGKVVARLRQYENLTALKADDVMATAEVVEASPSAKWSRCSAMVKVWRPFFRIELEARNVILDRVSIQPADSEEVRAPAPARFHIPQLHDPILIDGSLSEDKWRDAVGVDRGFMDIRTHTSIRRQTDLRIAADDRTLFVCARFTAGRPHGTKCTITEHDGPVWEDESLELIIHPDATEESPSVGYHLIVNCTGVIYDQKEIPPTRQEDKAWTCEGVQFKSGSRDGGFGMEIAIPLASVGIQPGRPFGLNVGRNLCYPAENASLTGGGFTDWNNMIPCAITPDAPAVQWGYAASADTGRIDLYATIRNTTSDLFLGKAILLQDNGTRQEQVETLCLKPRESRRLIVPGEPSMMRLSDLSLRVMDDKHAEWFSKSLRVNMDSLQAETMEQAAFRGPASHQVEFYPVQKKINIRLRDMRARQARIGKAYGRVIVSVYAQGSSGLDGQPIFRAAVDAPRIVENEGHVTVAYAPEADGTYLVRAVLHDIDGDCIETLADTMERRPIPWLGNSLGKDRVVIPPFTPLKAMDNTIECWGRQYGFNGTALPEHIQSQGEALLAGGIQLVLETEKGAEVGTPADAQVSWDEIAPDRADFRGKIRFESLTASVRGSMEYDGLIRYEITVTPTAPLSVKRLSLEVPLQQVRYLHAIGEIHTPAFYLMESQPGQTPDSAPPVWGTPQWTAAQTIWRQPGRFPASQGVIWSSVGAEGKQGSFLSSIWVGDHQRGFTWFADSDKDWVHDQEHPCLTLHREKDAFRLGVHLIAKPYTITGEHTYVFALAATPIRKRLVGSSARFQIGDLGGFANVWGKYREQGIVCKDFWLAKKHFAKAKREGLVKNVYMCNDLPAWGDADVRYMQYEWVNFPLQFYPGAQTHMPFKICGTAADNYLSVRAPLEPSRSDYTVFRMAQWIHEAEVGGIYMDECYPFRSTNIHHANGAYVHPNGKVRGVTYQLETRDLLKRCAVLGHLHGNTSPWVSVHMTGGMMPGVFSFADLCLDGEAGLPETMDYMDYWPMEYMEVTGAGAFGGNLAWLPMLGYGDRAYKQTKPTRTLMALLKLYDIWIWPTSLNMTVFRQLKDIEKEFGIGQDDCCWLGYWDKSASVWFPLPPSLRASAYYRPGKGALIYVSNFSKERQSITFTPDLRSLGIEQFSILDAETQQPLQDHELSIEGHDFRLLRVIPLAN
ncbi:MAG: hypothetical protein IT440_04945 [Phycisphaeraceae bacterium]|nr:hypothetical protein [Phycisphaeraceae bacterium]